MRTAERSEARSNAGCEQSEQGSGETSFPFPAGRGPAGTGCFFKLLQGEVDGLVGINGPVGLQRGDGVFHLSQGVLAPGHGFQIWNAEQFTTGHPQILDPMSGLGTTQCRAGIMHEVVCAGGVRRTQN